MLPLLPPDVDTLSDYPSDVDYLARRARGAPVLLAFPRAKSSAQMFDGEQIKSRERGRGWVLKIKGERRRTYQLQASLKTLKKPFRPCAVSLGGKPLRGNAWGYDRKQSDCGRSSEGKQLRLVVRRRCR